MDQFLFRLYRNYCPKWIKRGLSEETKDWLFGYLIYVASRPNMEALRLSNRAKSAVRNARWRDAIDHWQDLAIHTKMALQDPSADRASDAEITRKSKYVNNQLRSARLHLALELYEQGHLREFRELSARVMEMIPDQRILKKDPDIVALVTTYVRQALHEDHATEHLPARHAVPLRIVICLDVLKVSDVHTHARVIFTICRNLMAVNPLIETHVVITNERFAVTTPVVAQAFNPARTPFVYQLAQDAFEDEFGTRFFLHVMHNTGLEGLVRTSKAILDIAPDVILYGGGHRGLFSNESRLIRHVLYDHLPTAFFYMQSNNHVDEKIDMIIARGPHDITGDPGEALVRVQPYPTFDPQSRLTQAAIDMTRHSRKVIVSALTGVRMNVEFEELSDSMLRTMFSMLDRVPGSIWYLIGAQDPAALIASNPLIEQRVAQGQLKVLPVLPFDDFVERMQTASLFMHLPGFTGGSGGATVARRLGIPILTFRHSDVSGRQPAQTVFAKGDIKGWTTLGCNLLKDREAWREIVSAQYAHSQMLRDTSAERFYACLQETVSQATPRLEARAQDPKAVLPPVDKVEAI